MELKLRLELMQTMGMVFNSGHVRIYNYTPSGTASWTQLGADIDGEAAGEALYDSSGHER